MTEEEYSAAANAARLTCAMQILREVNVSRYQHVIDAAVRRIDEIRRHLHEQMQDAKDMEQKDTRNSD